MIDRSKDNMEDIKLNDCAVMLIDRLDSYGDNAINNRFKGYKSLIKGVLIIQEVIKKINPCEITEEVIMEIDKQKDYVLVDFEDKFQRVDSYMHIGILNSMMILWGMVNNKTLKKMR